MASLAHCLWRCVSLWVAGSWIVVTAQRCYDDPSFGPQECTMQPNSSDPKHYVCTMGVCECYETGLTCYTYASSESVTVYATASGTVAYAEVSQTEAYATTSGATAYATASGASAQATQTGADAYATASGAFAEASWCGAGAYATASGALAQAGNYDQFATASLTRCDGGLFGDEGALAFATASGAQAVAYQPGTIAHATASGATAFATAMGTVAYATVSGAIAEAQNDDAQALALVSGAVARASGTNGGQAYANVSGATAWATDALNGCRLRAHATASGACAYANCSEAAAYANVSGAIAHAIAPGACAHATAAGASAHATFHDAIASANVSGAAAWATAWGAMAAAGSAVARGDLCDDGGGSGAQAFANVSGAVAWATFQGTQAFATASGSRAFANCSLATASCTGGGHCVAQSDRAILMCGPTSSCDAMSFMSVIIIHCSDDSSVLDGTCSGAQPGIFQVPPLLCASACLLALAASIYIWRRQKRQQAPEDSAAAREEEEGPTPTVLHTVTLRDAPAQLADLATPLFDSADVAAGNLSTLNQKLEHPDSAVNMLQQLPPFHAVLALVPHLLPLAAALHAIHGLLASLRQADEDCKRVLHWTATAYHVVLQVAQSGCSNATREVLNPAIIAMQELQKEVVERQKCGWLGRLLTTPSFCRKLAAAEDNFDKWFQRLGIATSAEGLRVSLDSARVLRSVESKIDEQSAKIDSLMQLQKQVLRSTEKATIDEQELEMAKRLRLSPSQVRLDRSQCLGSGATSKVYKADYDGDIVAAKVVNLDGESNAVQKQIRASLAQEVGRMLPLSHHNVLRTFGIVDAAQALEIMMVMEYAAGGSLRGHLDRCGAGLGPVEAADVAKQVARGMNYLHSVARLAHKDLKSPNILIMENQKVKVADFGLSAVQSTLTSLTSKGGGSTPGSTRWMAPEAMDDDFAPRTSPMVSDVFSYGVVLFELLTAAVPWQGFPDTKIQVAVLLNNKRPDSLVDVPPSALADLMRQCWDQDPSRRPTFQNALQILDLLDTV